MIVAKTRCCECGVIIELDDEYGWTVDDECATNTICDDCKSKFEDYDEFEGW